MIGLHEVDRASSSDKKLKIIDMLLISRVCH